MTDLTDAGLNRALEIFQEFGPRRAIPVEGRWAEAFPKSGAEDHKEWKRLFEEIESFAYDLAEQVRDHRLDRDEAKRQIAERFPRLSSDRVGHTYSQAMYFSSK
jgi:hypothetical protein